MRISKIIVFLISIFSRKNKINPRGALKTGSDLDLARGPEFADIWIIIYAEIIKAFKVEFPFCRILTENIGT